jgi:hypothetical protein
MGRAELDLRQLPADAAVAPVAMTVGAGRLVVHVPAGAAVRIAAHAGAGDLRIQDGGHEYATDGLDVDTTRTLAGTGPTWNLSLRVGYGDVLVVR